MNNNTGYKGSCFCGSVQFALRGQPEAMAYCHCHSCRRWSAGAVNSFTLWQPDQLQVTEGAENIGMFDRNPGREDASLVSKRKWCKICGGHVFTDHPTMGLIDVPAVVIDEFEFEPGFHVHYQETVQPVKDGLPKFKDLPLEAGGSGENLPE
jgi:hypothetical protein